MYASSFTDGAPARVAEFRYAAPPPTQTKKKRRSSKSELTTSLFAWLRTNKQVHAEARPIFCANLCLQIDDVLSLSAFMSQSPETAIKPSMVQSLSFELKLSINSHILNGRLLDINSDLFDGFSFARAVKHGWERRGNVCTCPFCFAAGSSILENAAKHFTAMRELRLRISIGCKDGPENHRRFGDRRRGRDAPALVCRDNSEQIADCVKWVCTQAPLRVVSQVKLDSVDVQFSVEKIMHDPLVVFRSNGEDRCWCTSRMVDKESIDNCGIAEEIERRLMREDTEEEG